MSAEGGTGDVRTYAYVTAAYWADTITDGAIRVLVLFYFYQLGYSPLQVASLFIFYEVFGVITNLFGGWIAARWGLKSTLVGGLSLQIGALLMLALAPDTVRMEHAVANFPDEFPIKLLSQDGRPACAWTTRDFGPSGVIGDPCGATAEQGQVILDSLSSHWAQAIEEVHQLQWAPRAESTWGRSHQNGHIEQFPPP